MRRGPKSDGMRIPCPNCNRAFLKNGLASHLRACKKQIERAAGIAQLAAQVEASGGVPESISMAKPRARGHVAMHWDAVHSESFIEQVRRDMRGVEDAPPNWPEQFVEADTGPEPEGIPPANPLRAVFVDAVGDASTGSSSSAASSADDLRLPTFCPPVLENAPPIKKDDFLTVPHPHSKQPPTIDHFENFFRETPDVDPSRISHKPWDPFKSRVDFEFAEFANDAALNQGQVAKLLDLIASITSQPSEFSFRTYNDLKSAWETATYVTPGFSLHTITEPYQGENRTYAMHCRPLFEWSLSLVKDPYIAPKFTWHSQRLYKHNGKDWERFIDEPNTADSWWHIESSLPSYGCVLGYIVYADKTRLSSFGTKKGYPVMARIANLPRHIRNGRGYGGGQIVGFLPIVEDEKHEGKKTFTNYKRIIWHKAFWELLKTISSAAKTGYKVQCGDGVERVLYPVILMLVADYEEQAIMSLIRGPNGLCPCPVCEIPQDKQIILGVEPTYPYRNQAYVQSIVEDSTLSKKAKESKLKPLGIRSIENVFWKLPNFDLHRALSWDRLHAYHGGLFSDHLFAQFQEIMGEMGRPIANQVDEQYDAMPRWRGLNHFSEVIKVNFTDGSKYEDISKVIVPASYNVLTRATSLRGYLLLKATRCYVVLDMLAGLEVHLGATLQMYAKGLVKYSEAIQEYAAHNPDKNWNFPKDHTHQHLIGDIISKGVSANMNTKLFEPLHGPVKSDYENKTNFKEVESQLSGHQHRTTVSTTLRARTNAVDELNKPKASESPSAVNDFQFTHIRLGSKRGACTLQQVKNAYMGDSDFARFPMELEEYLNRTFATVSSGGWVRLRYDYTVIEARYIRVNYESRVSWKLNTDHLRCNPSFQKATRYDHVIYQIDADTIGFAQLKFVFTCKFGRDNTHVGLAMVNFYDIPVRRTATERDLGLCRIRRRRAPAEFIPVSSIVRGALVVKDFGRDDDSFLVMDTVDGDMFLRLKQDVPQWDT